MTDPYMRPTTKGLIQTSVELLTWPNDEEQIPLTAQLSPSWPQPIPICVLEGAFNVPQGREFDLSAFHLQALYFVLSNANV